MKHLSFEHAQVSSEVRVIVPKESGVITSFSAEEFVGAAKHLDNSPNSLAADDLEYERLLQHFSLQSILNYFLR